MPPLAFISTQSRVLVGNLMGDYLRELLRQGKHESYYLLADAKVWHLSQGLIAKSYPELTELPHYLINDPEGAKSLEGIAEMARWLLEQGAHRGATLIALGGGAVSDAVGFLAQIYMRGVSLVLLPTTLLAMADAAVGGKCGINFAGVKNLLGAFASESATLTLCDTVWLESLPEEELRSGCGELIKYGLLVSPDLWHRLLQVLPEQPFSLEQLTPLIREAVRFKLDIVAQDRLDQGLRHQLNLGHTFGHAFEAWSHQHSDKPLLHGEAVALGLVPELYLSHVKLGFPKKVLHQLLTIVQELYRPLAITCRDYDALRELMLHDKKNSDAELISTVALTDIGQVHKLQNKPLDITEALDYYQDTML
ncbi:3-dehydroquinate synthase [Porphyromonas asaccharolytica]|uniref:3-dehydroquinate synthase n=1 Tax=Porphyromonas asaccharolytica (strain ATCC 25260 / DSM 20707 / BCRC 10618 / CCUG 7834 / JCM 6326 / LMG 13178 / VPI 4198 / B440) TaxID=879243 RepID=F4KL75_PORAD|nr:3-dehydroquinate synthase family protein [Porphyromonas asaccharolytica]AEE12049.1 3-dehydroquinate synthase [Porphyromonas asaccharolytica DSM 20707]